MGHLTLRLLSSRSCVRITQGALIKNPVPDRDLARREGFPVALRALTDQEIEQLRERIQESHHLLSADLVALDCLA